MVFRTGLTVYAFLLPLITGSIKPSLPYFYMCRVRCSKFISSSFHFNMSNNILALLLMLSEQIDIYANKQYSCTFPYTLSDYDGMKHIIKFIKQHSNWVEYSKNNYVLEDCKQIMYIQTRIIFNAKSDIMILFSWRKLVFVDLKCTCTKLICYI